MPDEKTYVIDALYGKWELDNFMIRLIKTPEVQRLRDIRLSNINSLFLPGSANVSRFEHSLGVAYLAQQVTKRRPFSVAERFNLVAAGLLHDIGMPPFGHTVEFLLRRFGFDHEKTSSELIRGAYHERGNFIRQFSFCGRLPEVYDLLRRSDEASVEEVAQIIEGKSSLSKLIKGSMDLDNIDGVYRMMHHTGSFKSCHPLTIVANFNKRGDDICFNEEGIKFIKQWNEDRGTLYSELLRNQADCQAKAMLSTATELALNDGTLDECCWKLTESEFIMRLLKHPKVGKIMKDFLSGRLYDVVGRFIIEEKDVRGVLPIMQSNRQNFQKELQDRMECRMRKEDSIGNRRSFDVVVDIVSAAERRGVANLAFLPTDLLSKVVDKSVDRSITRWVLGVYTSRKMEGANLPHISFMCQEILSTMLGLDLKPLEGETKQMGGNE